MNGSKSLPNRDAVLAILLVIFSNHQLYRLGKKCIGNRSFFPAD
jgi:hypothetical protein